MAEYHVATNGTNTNAGTLIAPWATWQYGFNQLSAGDTLYIHGGTYYAVATVGLSNYNGVLINGIHGTSANPINVFAYQNEVPILDCINMGGSTYSKTAIYINNCSYWHLRGLHTKRAAQSPVSAKGGGGIEIYNSQHNLIENCKAYEHGGGGFLCKTPSGDENHFLNCDSYDNVDPYSALPGDNADGFSFGYLSGDYIVRVTGCRSWNNSDDGYDCYQGVGYSGKVVFTNSWAWGNGLLSGQGCGFKLGLDSQTYDGVTRRWLYNCIAYDNKSRGFSQESANVKKEFYNCVAYANNSHGFSFIYIDIPDILRNNVSFDNVGDDIEDLGVNRISDHNSWDGGVTATSADFVSVNGATLSSARQTNGNLPVLTFLHLAGGSDLIAAGVAIAGSTVDGDGYLWGTPPSMGAFETGSTPPPDNVPVTSITITAPIYTITVDDGTLQLTANVSPANATNQSVIWTITSGTASVSPSGLVSAISNGTITVRATAADGSGIFGTVVITISGQVTGGVPQTGLRDRDGNLYTTVVIDDMEWIIENLRTTHYADGTPILNLTDCSNGTTVKYGALYNWYATDTGKLAPTGWHVPSEIEFDSIIASMGGAATAGQHSKESGTAYWNAPSAGDNSNGFNGRGCGYRRSDLGYEGIFAYLKDYANYRTTKKYITTSEAKTLFNANNNFATSYSDLGSGQPVRCINNSTSLADGQTGTVTDIDGNTYTTKCYGALEIMTQDLFVKQYNDGTPIPNITDNVLWAADTLGAMCWYNNDENNAGETILNGWSSDISGAYVWYDNDINNKDPYGALYNWFAVDNAAGLAYLERNGIRETGWHVPTVAEFQSLFTYVGGEAIAAAKLKEIGTDHWTSEGAGTDNSSGFTAVGAGWREWSDCTFVSILEELDLWSADEVDINEAYEYWLYYDSSVINTGEASPFPSNKKYGLSVRLVRDYTAVPPEPPEPPVPPYYPDVVPYNYGAIPTYRFYISTAYTGSAISYEVFPLKFLSTTLNYELEGNQIFYRRKFNGSLLFGTNSTVIDENGLTQNRKDDWLLFWGIEQSATGEKLYLTITKEFGGFVDTYWEGYFATNDGKFDIDQCTFEVTPIEIDDYTDIIEGGDTQYNILNVPAIGTVTAVYHGTTNYTYTRTRWLTRIGSSSVIEYLADQISPGANVVSDFFTNPINPITLEANHLLYLTIAQKSDIIRNTSSDAATTAMLSWDELMEILWVMFEVKWNYDLPTNTFTVEHISDYTHPAGIDLRAQLSCIATNKYQYLKEKMPKYESFAFMEADDFNFVGTPIWYDSPEVNTDPVSNRSESIIPVTTELEFIIESPDGISDDGFVILCNYESGGNYFVRSDFGRLDTAQYQLNMDLSVANLMHSYHKFERVLDHGYLNSAATTFFTARKTKQQQCSAIICDELDPSGTITTELGETYFGGAKAIIKNAEHSPTGEIKFTLLYGPIPAANPGVPDDIFGVFIYPSLHDFDYEDNVYLDFVFTIPCPGNYNIRVREYVYDDSDVLHDVSAWENITFLAGTTGYTHVFTYVHPLLRDVAVPHCFTWHARIETEYTLSEIDSFHGQWPPAGCPNDFIYGAPYLFITL